MANAIGLVALALTSAALVLLVPAGQWGQFWEPTTQAIYACLLSVCALVVLRRLDRIRLERLWLAVFLATMPLVYLLNGVHSGASGGLWIEGVGFALFGALALLGWYVSPWFLALGIVGHGLGWDVWHLHSTVVPGWYAQGCAVIDLGLACYVASRVRPWNERAARGRH